MLICFLLFTTKEYWSNTVVFFCFATNLWDSKNPYKYPNCRYLPVSLPPTAVFSAVILTTNCSVLPSTQAETGRLGSAAGHQTAFLNNTGSLLQREI
jgi:hypothetical protein